MQKAPDTASSENVPFSQSERNYYICVVNNDKTIAKKLDWFNDIAISFQFL